MGILLCNRKSIIDVDLAHFRLAIYGIQKQHNSFSLYVLVDETMCCVLNSTSDQGFKF